MELQIGDDVIIERGLHQGKTGEVQDVDEDTGMVTVEVQLFGEGRQTAVPFSDITPVSDDPDEVFGSVVEHLRDALRTPVDTELQHWWARQALDGRDPSEALLDEYRSFRDQLEAQFEQTVGERVMELKEELDTSDAAAMRAWLADHREQLEREWGEKVDKLERELRDKAFSADQIRQRLEAALDNPERPDVLADEDVELQVGRDMIKPLVEDGLQLWRTTRELVSPDEDDN